MREHNCPKRIPLHEPNWRARCREAEWARAAEADAYVRRFGVSEGAYGGAMSDVSA